jgi:hypothetical protein
VSTARNIESGFPVSVLLDMIDGLPGPYHTARRALHEAVERVTEAKTDLKNAESNLVLIRRAIALDLGRCADEQIGRALEKAFRDNPITASEV